LLDSKGNSFALGIDGQNHGFQLVTLVEVAYRVFAGFFPGDVGKVHQTVDTAFQADEDAEVSDGLDLAGDAVAFLVVGGESFPRIGQTLLDAQGNTTAIFVDIQDHHFHFVADLYHFGRVDVLVGPVHFGNVNQAFHAFLDLGEAAVIG